jgi:hypothetical protein
VPHATRARLMLVLALVTSALGADAPARTGSIPLERTDDAPLPPRTGRTTPETPTEPVPVPSPREQVVTIRIVTEASAAPATATATATTSPQGTFATPQAPSTSPPLAPTWTTPSPVAVSVATAEVTHAGPIGRAIGKLGTCLSRAGYDRICVPRAPSTTQVMTTYAPVQVQYQPLSIEPAPSPTPQFWQPRPVLTTPQAPPQAVRKSWPF